MGGRPNVRRKSETSVLSKTLGCVAPRGTDSVEAVTRKASGVSAPVECARRRAAGPGPRWRRAARRPSTAFDRPRLAHLLVPAGSAPLRAKPRIVIPPSSFMSSHLLQAQVALYCYSAQRSSPPRCCCVRRCTATQWGARYGCPSANMVAAVWMSMRVASSAICSESSMP